VTTNAKSGKAALRSHKKAKIRGSGRGNLLSLAGREAPGAGKLIKAASGGDDSVKVESPKRRLRRPANPAMPKKTARKSANDVMLDAWEYTYRTRDRRPSKT